MLRSTINSYNWRTLLQSRCLRRILHLLHPLLSSKPRPWPIGHNHWRRRAVTRTRRRRCPSGWCWSCFQFSGLWWRAPNATLTIIKTIRTCDARAVILYSFLLVCLSDSVGPLDYLPPRSRIDEPVMVYLKNFCSQFSLLSCSARRSFIFAFCFRNRILNFFCCLPVRLCDVCWLQGWVRIFTSSFQVRLFLRIYGMVMPSQSLPTSVLKFKL